MFSLAFDGGKWHERNAAAMIHSFSQETESTTKEERINYYKLQIVNTASFPCFLRLVDDSLYTRHQSDQTPVYIASIHHEAVVDSMEQELKACQNVLESNVNLNELKQSRLPELVPIALKHKYVSFEGIIFVVEHLVSNTKIGTRNYRKTSKKDK